MRIGLLVIAGLALVGFLVVAVVLPNLAGNEAKEAGTALVAGAEEAKAKVAAAAEKAASLDGSGKDVKVASKADPKHGELKWVVDGNGVIRGWNEKNALEITLKPTLNGGKVAWACSGYTRNAMPVSCGGTK